MMFEGIDVRRNTVLCIAEPAVTSRGIAINQW
jgi:hypothetical protein